MTDAAFILALTLGAAVLSGMLWVSHAASFRLSIRQRYRRAALHPSGPDFEEEPELDLGDPRAEQRQHEAA